MYKFIKDYFIYKFKKLLILYNSFYYKYIFKSNTNFNKIIKQNREFLTQEGSFISSIDFRNNDYGIGESIKITIDNKINFFPINTDLIIYLILKNIKNNCKYLEIGASVLKNFMQVNNSLSNSDLYIYDLNPVNPKYKNEFLDLNKKSDSEKNNTQNKLMYFRGDLFNLNDLSNFKDHSYVDKFNFIYSDALHTPEAIYREYKDLISSSLSDKFIIYYDDLDIKGMTDMFKKIFYDLKINFNDLNAYTFYINGWVGQNERPHKNGIITNLPLTSQIKDLKLMRTKIL